MVLFQVPHTVVQRELLSIDPDCLLLFLWVYVWISILLAFKTGGADQVLSVSERKAFTSLVLDGIICSNLVTVRWKGGCMWLRAPDVFATAT